MQKFAVLVFLSLSFYSCSKKETSVGHIQFVNDDRDVYEAYIDGKPKGIIEAYSTQTFDVSVGAHQIKALEMNNTANLSFTASPNVVADQSIYFAFPH